MAEPRIRTARHTIRVAAHPRHVYRLIADVSRWPQIFEPTITVEHLGHGAAGERVRLWELIGGEVHNVVTHRVPNPRRLQLRFRHEGTPHPVASMGGLWLVLPKGNGCLVVLDHHYRVTGDDPADVAWLADAVEHNGSAVLTGLKETAELAGDLDRLWLSCVDEVDVDGDARDVYDFLARAQDYPQRLPQVDRLRFDENDPGIQHLDTDTRLPDGTVHTTSSIRVCVPDGHIVFKQTRPPAIMRAHTGTYAVTRLPRGTRATARHTVLLRHDTATGTPGLSTVDDVRAAVCEVLHGLSRVTLGRAKEFAEARRPQWAGAVPL